jgi:predicted DNA binding CopG/RHH family protein
MAKREPVSDKMDEMLGGKKVQPAPAAVTSENIIQSVRLDKARMEALKRYAAHRGLSLATQIRMIIYEFMNQNGVK